MHAFTRDAANLNSNLSTRSDTVRTLAGPGATLLVIALLELLAATGHPLAAPGTILALPVAYAALIGGLIPGLASAAAAILYSIFFFAIPGRPFQYLPDDLQRLLTTAVITPAIAILAANLRQRGLDLAIAETARQQADDGRRRVTGIVESITDAFFALDRDWRFIFVNSKAAELLRTDADSLIGQRFQEAKHALHLPQLESEIARSLRESVTIEFVERDAAQRTAWAIHLYPSSDSLSVYLQDITAKERAEDALRVSEAKFSGIVSIASDAIISIDSDQVILNFNHGAEEIFGYSAAEVVGKHIEILLPMRFHQGHRAHVRSFGESSVNARRMGERREISGRRKNGEEFPADASISKLDVAGDRIFTVVLRDITERKRNEQTQRFLAEAGNALTASLDVDKTLETVAGLIVPAIADWCVIYARDKERGLVRAALGHRDSELQQKLRAAGLNMATQRPQHPVHHVFDTGQPLLIPQMTNEQLVAMAEDPGHEELLRNVGARSAIMVPMIARGETTGAIGFFITTSPRVYDVEDLTLAQEVARRAALAIDNARLYSAARSAIQARDDVLAVVSHDLGNPLSAIRIGTTLLLSSVPAQERETGGWKHIMGIRNSAEQMERLIKDLLEVKRIEAGQLSIERARVAVAPLVAEAIELLTPIAEGKNIKLQPAVAASVTHVYADRERLLQSFSNLVGNAVKFTPDSGVIQIAVHPHGDDVEFVVQDNGIGIAPEDVSHVFDRYWQAQSRKKGKVGIGLGLVIVKGIIEAHGGKVWVESTVGVGSQFHFTVPAWRNQIEE